MLFRSLGTIVRRRALDELRRRRDVPLRHDAPSRASDALRDIERAKLATLDELPENMRLSCQVRCCDDLRVRILRRLSENPDMGDAGPEPETWPLMCP